VTWLFQIAGCSATDEAVQFRLERANFFTRQAPQDRYSAPRCRWEFGGLECGYVINEVAAFVTCPKTLDACIARGQDHASRGLPVLHPGRFGGFPGIAAQP
jgi:phage-related protein